MGRILVLFLVALTVACSKGNRGEPTLKIQGTRDVTGVSFTNQEESALQDCDATVTDSTATKWVAVVPGRVEMNQRVTLDWSDFKADGRPLPAYLGRSRGVIVSCHVIGLNERRSGAAAR